MIYLHYGITKHFLCLIYVRYYCEFLRSFLIFFIIRHAADLVDIPHKGNGFMNFLSGLEYLSKLRSLVANKTSVYYAPLLWLSMKDVKEAVMPAAPFEAAWRGATGGARLAQSRLASPPSRGFCESSNIAKMWECCGNTAVLCLTLLSDFSRRMVTHFSVVENGNISLMLGCQLRADPYCKNLSLPRNICSAPHGIVVLFFTSTNEAGRRLCFRSCCFVCLLFVYLKITLRQE